EASDHFVLEEKVGPVPIRIEAGEQPLIWLRTPPISWKRIYDRALCAKALGLDIADLLDVTPQLLSAGNPTLFIALKDKRTVDRSWFDTHGLSMIKDATDE